MDEHRGRRDDAPRRFERVAIVNRGEAAMRLVHAVRELSAEAGAGGRMATVALYTDPDRRAMFVREADAAVPLGPATFVDPEDGRRKSAYLDYARLERALVEARADAAWVGWGFVSEHAEFAELCARLGIAFIGPSAEVMRRLADKITAKRLAEQADLPVAPWSGGPVGTLDEARRKARELGYPLMLKASAGGGGRGIRAIASEEDLSVAFDRARAEALAAFGDATVFLERRVPGARHVEVQILADRHGAAWAVGVRDCTLQRRHQKVLEEAPSPALSPEQDREIRAAAARLARIAGYENAGTVEFLYDPATRRFAFMEVNARLQVEHPVTEETTGLDLVKLQIHVARGGRLVGEPPAPRGHAIEVRLNAEDPESEFAPAPGRIELLRLPAGPGLRVDCGVAEGDEVPPDFDSMIAKIIAWGTDRDEALARLRRGLAEAAIVIRGGTSNKAFLLGLLGMPEVRASAVDNGWLDRLAARGGHVSNDHAEVALLAAATEAYLADRAADRATFYAWAARGRPRIRAEVGRVVELRRRGRDCRLRVLQIAPGTFEIDAGGGAARVHVERVGPFERRLSYAGRSYRVIAAAQDTSWLVEVEGVAHRVCRDAGGMVRAPAPALVLSIAAQPGDEVEAGARLATLEAMKMEMAVAAPFAGRVREVLAMPNAQVAAGAPLVRLEPRGGPRAEAAEPLGLVVDPEPGLLPPAARWARAGEDLRRLLLGFDVDATCAERLAAEWGALAAALPPGGPDPDRDEEDALALFADVHALFRHERADGDGRPRPIPGEHLAAFVRAPSGRGEGLPASFLAELRRALAHHGVHGIDPCTELEEALVRIHEAFDRGERAAKVAAAILERWRVAPPPREGAAGDRLRALLDRIAEVAHARFPALVDLALAVRHRAAPEQRRRGHLRPRDIVELLAPAGGSSTFVEHDLDAEGRLVPVDRPLGASTAHVVVGTVTSVTPLYPEGMTRVVLLGDPGKEMGSLADPECARIVAALDLAERMRVPVDWFTVSAGARISMTSGTENLDATAAALRRIVLFTQAGLEINVVVAGVNVGAQAYWNAEATMLMHTRGILVMTRDTAMVLTGKQALDYAGSVSAEDNRGIGGYDRIMGPNGQAQYWAEDVAGACRVLFAHHELTYVAPGERCPRRARTDDPPDRDVRAAPHPEGYGFATVGDVFSAEKNPGRKRPFDVRAVMRAVTDGDHPSLERWRDMRGAETAVVWDARVGGHAACVVGIESRPLPRLGFAPAHGPDQWSAGTLFPGSSKKVARALNAASGRRPVVVLANLTGFDGSPESMECLQLEYGAEIGRAIVNFEGSIVFCVLSRYHGGAFVVFSKRLNEGLCAVAIEGAHASVIGGAPAAAVVFARDVDARTGKDPRIASLDERIAATGGDERRALAAQRAELWPAVRSEKLGEVAEAFDRVHSVDRALEVGSLDLVLPPARLRPFLVEALDRAAARAARRA
jgi:acetyl/propionyl-CoA carboxylase alpha subunit/acetyl-CoA carboxylase carboxyltransferase component